MTAASRALAALLAALLIAACGGGGGQGPAPRPVACDDGGSGGVLIDGVCL